MNTMLTCLRCTKLARVIVLDEGGDEVEVADIDVEGYGMLTYICPECLTDAETVFRGRRAAVAVLDTAERGIAGLAMVLERIPACRDDPKFKEQMAFYESEVAKAQAMLEALGSVDTEEGSG